MVLLSAIFGGLLVIPVYLLIRTLLGRNEAIVGSLFVILNPFIADMSAQAMSDVTSVFFVTLAVCLLYFGLTKKNNKVILLSAAICGFSVAVRLTNLLLFPFFIVVAYINVPQMPNRKAFITLFISFMAFFGVIAYLPLLFELGFSGFVGFMTQYNASNAVSYTFETMMERTLVLGNNLFFSITPIASIISLVGIYQFFVKHKAILRDIFVWILPYLIFFLLYGPADHMNRFILPVYPALALLFTYGVFASISKLKKIVNVKKANFTTLTACSLVLLVFGSIIAFSLPTYGSLEYWSENPAPSKAIAYWINQTIPANSVIIGGQYCWVLAYYVDTPNCPHAIIWNSDPSEVTHSINKSLAEGDCTFIVSDQLESYKFLIENFNVTFYAKYDETVSLYEILPKSSG
jgi:4-amino-4-deoxy-L-arabinose transferase-like glycosyltransferase